MRVDVVEDWSYCRIAFAAAAAAAAADLLLALSNEKVKVANSDREESWREREITKRRDMNIKEI